MRRLLPSDASNNEFLDRFGKKERSGVGARRNVCVESQTLSREDEVQIRDRLLQELSQLRGHHESLQRQREDPPPASSDALRYDPNLFGNNSLPRDRGQSSVDEHATNVRLNQDDKDAIEALFASDDFAEMFNAGGLVSKVPSTSHNPKIQAPSQRKETPVRLHDHPQRLTQETFVTQDASLAPVCHICARSLAPNDIAAFVSKTFDPAKPTRRRKAK